MGSPLYNSIQFLQSFGFFDIILPFLLVFTVVFGILEKTKIFGTEKVKDKDVTRKNINAMVAFSIAFFVVAATKVVSVIQTALPLVILVLIFIIAFLVLFGSMMGEGQLNFWDENNKKLKGVFVFGIFIAMIAIILGGFGLLGSTVNYIFENFKGTAVTSVVFLLVILGAIWYVMSGKSEGNSVDDSE